MTSLIGKQDDITGGIIGKQEPTIGRKHILLRAFAPKHGINSPTTYWYGLLRLVTAVILVLRGVY